jgi:tetratricopeptide (TPR) repeat protein
MPPLSVSAPQEALRRALELDPALLQLHPELASVAQRAEAAALKDKGNAAFGAGKFEEAVSHFSRCIELDAG